MIDPEEYNVAFKARLDDSAYAARLAAVIDEFNRVTKGLTILDIVKDQQHQDLVETLARCYHTQPFLLAAVMLTLGIYLAQKDEAGLPTEMN